MSVLSHVGGLVQRLPSYLYFDATRYGFGQSGEILEYSDADLAKCQNYNNYKYGLDHRYGYAAAVTKSTILDNYATRSMVFLLGSEDRERSWSLDESCEVEVQGKNRYERGLLYQHHLETFRVNSQDSKHSWMIVQGIGHDSKEIFTHARVIERLKLLTF